MLHCSFLFITLHKLFKFSMDTNNYNNQRQKKLGYKYITCPTCQGTGLCQENTLPLIDNCISKSSLNNIYIEQNKIKIEKDSNHEFVEDIPASNFFKRPTKVDFQDLSYIMDNFLHQPKNIQNPLDSLKIALQKLKKSDYVQNIIALNSILNLCNSHPKLVEPIMSTVYRKLSSLLQNSRSQIVSSVAQATAQFFEVMQYAQRPEFDELATTILQKTAHMNKNVKESMNKALDTMVLNISPCHCVRVLTLSASNKNIEVRITVSRLLKKVVNVIGEKNLLNSTTMKESRHKIFETLAQFITDGNQETRTNARDLIKLLLTHNEFENCFYQDVDLELFKKIEKDFISIKYE